MDENDRSPKPKSCVELDGSGIPEEVKVLRRWVNWRYVLRKGKWTKVPLNPSTGNAASCNDPTTWGSYEEAVERLKRGEADGIGFQLGPPYVGIDLDKCRDAETGAIEPLAHELICSIDSYSETSPSKSGVHILAKGQLPQGARRKGRLEMYESSRYFTMTGQHIEGTPKTIEERTQELADLHARVFDERRAKSKPTNGAGSANHPLTDAELIEKARRAENGAKFDRLWRGDFSEYDSQSEADLALSVLLAFWSGRNRARMDRLFRQSGLFRPKWDERHGADGRSYGQITIDKAIGHPLIPKRSFKNTDYGNAERLVANYGADIRFCHVWGRWLHWDGMRWAIDESGEIVRLAKATVRSIYQEAATIEDEAPRKVTANWARESEKALRIEAMIRLAQSEQGIPVHPDGLDRGSWLLNCTNGTIDLATGELRPHRPEDMMTKLAAVKYDPAAKSPRWKRFLQEVFEPHPDLIDFIQRAVGYSLTGDTREECLLLLWGLGRNGKGTLIKILASMLGDYAGTADFSAFVQRRHDNGPRDDIANMKGKRFVSAQESREGAALAESLIKWLTGGDRVRARRLYENSYEFDPTHKIWLATNHKPVIRGTDSAIWSRLKLIPFEVSFEGREDKTLKQALLRELPGILAWALEGCRLWQKEGLSFPESVINATGEYRRDSDHVGRFIEECCAVGQFAQGSYRSVGSRTTRAGCESQDPTRPSMKCCL
jgi:putative DNA primase/helicase